MNRSTALVVYAGVAWLFVAGAMIQIFLAGLGVFNAAPDFRLHREWGFAIGWLTLVLLVVALAGRLPRRMVGLAAGLLLLFALQSILVAARASAPEVAALHPVNGVFIVVIALIGARDATTAVRGAEAER